MLAAVAPVIVDVDELPIRNLPDHHRSAEIYESAFVPAFFAEWAPILCEAAECRPATTSSTSRVVPASWPVPQPDESARATR